MKLDVRHTFRCTPEQYWELYWDPAFEALLAKDSTVDREVVHESTAGDIVTRRLRFTPHHELPGAAAAIVGSKKLVYEQENVLDKARGVMTWKVLPTLLPGKLTAGGTFEVKPHPQGCEQIVLGEITVRVPLVGGRIESAVVDQVKQGYVKMAEATREYLASRAVS